MKQLITILILLLSFNSFAQNESDPLYYVRANSKIILKVDLVIPANNKLMLHKGKTYKWFSEVSEKGPGCRLITYFDMDGLSEIRIPKGSILPILQDRVVSDRGTALISVVQEDDFLKFVCWNNLSRSGKGQGTPSIEEFRVTLGDLADLVLQR